MKTAIQIARRQFDSRLPLAPISGVFAMVSLLWGAGPSRTSMAPMVAWILTGAAAYFVSRPGHHRFAPLFLLAALPGVPFSPNLAEDTFLVRVALVFAALSTAGKDMQAQRASYAQRLSPLYWGAMQSWCAIALSQHTGSERWLSILLYLSLALALGLPGKARAFSLVPQTVATIGLIASGHAAPAWILLGWAGHVVRLPAMPGCDTRGTPGTLDLRAVLGVTILGLELLLIVGPLLGARSLLVPAKNLLALAGLAPP